MGQKNGFSHFPILAPKCMRAIPPTQHVSVKTSHACESYDKYVTIKKEEWMVPVEYDGVVPSCAGEKLKWKYIF